MEKLSLQGTFASWRLLEFAKFPLTWGQAKTMGFSQTLVQLHHFLTINVIKTEFFLAISIQQRDKSDEN